MLKKIHRLSHTILIALIASLVLAPVLQAAYDYQYKLVVDHTRVAGLDGTPPTGFGFLKSITIDHTRVAGLDVTPPDGFGYVKRLTIDYTKVGGTTDLANFPVLVSIPGDAGLKTTANGGRVTDAEGDDIVFYAADLATQLDYEVEQYDGAAGTLVAWVRLPVLEVEIDTVFYLAYGNGSITNSLADPAGVWDSNFKGVWHLKEATDATNMDSTGNANNGTPVNSPAASAGKIAGALDFEGAAGTRVALGTSASLDMSQFTNWTMTAWVKPSANFVDSDYPLIYAYGDWEVGLDLAVREGPQDGRIEYWLKDRVGLWSDTALNVGAWNHVVVVHTPTKTYFYLNGNADGSYNNDTIGTDNSGSYIGGYPGYANGDLKGLIDEVHVSNTNRSAGWIQTEYNNQNNPGGFMTIEEGGALTDFPVLVSIHNDATIKTTANGGRVTDPQGDDLVFYAADLTTVLKYEVEQYDPAAGTLVAWVRLPTLASNVDTVFYLAYGNSGISTSLADSDGVWDTGYLGVWHLNDDTDATNIDSTVNSNDGSPSGSPAATTASRIAGALVFDGSNDYISLEGQGIENHGYDAVTIEAWYKSSSSAVSDDQYIYTHMDSTWNDYVNISPTDDSGNVDRIRVTLADGGAEGYVYGTTDVVDQQWHHVAMVRTGGGAGSRIKIYVDGIKEADVADPSGGGVIDLAAADFGPFIGDSPGDTEQVDGVLDEVRVSSTARSAAWISTEFNNQSNPGGFMTIQDSGPLVDFPVLVTILDDAQLKTTANDGQVTDAEGDDIIFATGADGSGQLDHEVESYDPVTGSLVAWVRIPALAVAADTVFYLHYGNDTVNTSQENATGVWDSNYRGVWHLNDPTDATVMDSTGYANNGTPSGSPVATTGSKIGGALDFDGNDDKVSIGSILGSPETVTVSAWVKHDTLPADQERYLDFGDDVVIRHDGQNSVGQLHFYIRTDGGNNRSLRVDGALTTGAWYYVTGTWDGKTQRVYLNGLQMDSQAPGGILDTPGSGVISHSTETMDGVIDEVRVSDMARPVDWITTTWNNQRWPNKAQHPAEGFITVVRSVCDLAAPVACGSITAGSIETPGAWDAYKVTIASDTWLDLYTTGTTDTYGYLYDENCVEIAQDDTTDYNFRISQTVAAGTYYVQVRHALEFETGDYELNVECGDDDHGDSIDDASSLDCGSPAGGRIDSVTDEDYFKVVFWGTGLLTAATSGGTDTRGTLLDDGGNFIAADDNSKDGSNFEIVRTVGPGVYYVVVSAGAAGDYSVEVDCEYTPVITATAEYGGSISPAGGVGVTYDGTQTFTITPDAGNTVRDVWVDGVWVGAVTSYEFQNVQKDHKIVAVFNADFENCVDIPDIPLDAWYRSAPANVMFVLDDSGSMDWEFMTIAGDGLFDNYYRYVFDNPGDNLYGRVLPDDRRLKWKSQWAGYNKLYYDPAVTYTPWPNHVAGDAAAFQDPADPDTPRSHPMIATRTFDLNKTYIQYTDDTVADVIIVNDQDIKFSKTPAASGGAELSTGFEGDKNTWDDGFDGSTNWKQDKNEYHNNAKSAVSTNNAYGNLISDNIDASDLVVGDKLVVDFYFRKIEIEDGDFNLYYLYGNNEDFIVDLNLYPAGDPGGDGEWIHYRDEIEASKYFVTDFRIKLRATMDNKREKVWLDDVLIAKDTGLPSWELATGIDGAYAGDPDDPDKPGEYWWTAADGDYTATWRADIPADGDYDVFARWTADANHSESVRYTVYHHGGSAAVDVNQRLNGGKWVKLGTYAFDDEDDTKVVLSHTRNGDDDRAVADAIKIAPAGAIDAIDIIRAHYYTWSETTGKPYLVVLDGNIAYYEITDADGDDKIDAGEITVASSPPADVQTGRDYIAERQNFANWYQFYRRRELAATAAVANTIAGLKGVQVGFYSINGNLVQPAVPVKSAGIDKSKNLLQALYNLKVRAQGTPLRRGLREVGKYYADSSDMIGSSPYATTENGGACQQAFTIVMTDGFWNGSTPSVGNTDGDDNTAYDGGGRADIYFNSLADVAMKYYETDLHTGLDDTVPVSALDSAKHQHMVTYSVSFGRVGSLNPDDYDIAGGSYPAWPDPRYVNEHKIDDLWHAAVNGRGEFLNASSPTELIDSLLAISRSIQSRIASSSSVSVNGDPLYQELDEYTRMYQATYRSDSWVGDVSAYQIDAATGELATVPEWTAAGRLETVDWYSERIIATYNGANGIPFRYDRNVLSSAQQRALGSDLDNDSDAEQNAAGILDYVRGDRSNEVQNSGSFRDRFQVLGDIVHSSPVYHNGMLYAGGNDGMLHAFDAASGDERFAYVPNLVFGNLTALADPKYSHKYFVDLSPTIRDVTIGGQDKTILVGGLGKGGKGYYALDITDPADITDEDKLAARVRWEFPDPYSENTGYLAYDNQLEPIAVGDVIYTQGYAAKGTIVAIPLADAAEGTGVLDITFAPGEGMFQDGEDLYVSGDVKVAKVDGALYDPYMGYSYSRPVIARSNDPSAEWLVIFGNGYNSAISHAVLYILNLHTGELINRIDTGVGNCNGLSSPIAIDIDANGTADYVYAGDLQGNLWKFDLFDTDAANWEVAYADPGGNPAPVFQAKNYSGHHQPITSKPDVMYHCSQPGYLVVFGTGRYLTELDLESSESASIYGIWDYGDDDDDSEYLGSFERTASPQLYNPHLDGVPSRTRVKLLEQTVEPGTWATADGQGLRILTDNQPVWGTVADSDTDQADPQPDPGSTADGDTVHAGWYFDLPNVGEMAVSDVIIRDGRVLVISFTPGKDPCGSGGTSIFHAMETCTGARPDKSVFVGINEVVHDPVSGGQTTIANTSSNWKEPTGKEFVGRVQPPVILRKGNLEYHYLSSSTGDVYKEETAGAILGIYYWQQIE